MALSISIVQPYIFERVIESFSSNRSSSLRRRLHHNAPSMHATLIIALVGIAINVAQRGDCAVVAFHVGKFLTLNSHSQRSRRQSLHFPIIGTSISCKAMTPLDSPCLSSQMLGLHQRVSPISPLCPLHKHLTIHLWHGMLHSLLRGR